MEDEYHITKHTVNHTSPSQGADINRIQESMEKNKSFIFSPGQKAPKVSDYFGQGTNELSKALTWAAVGVIHDKGEGEGNIEGGIELRVDGEDLGADVN